MSVLIHLLTFLGLEFELVYAPVFAMTLIFGILPSLAVLMSLSVWIFQDTQYPGVYVSVSVIHGARIHFARPISVKQMKAFRTHYLLPRFRAAYQGAMDQLCAWQNLISFIRWLFCGCLVARIQTARIQTSEQLSYSLLFQFVS